ncbi:MAG: cell filamentation protein Fic [Anaerolinea sp.]|nr:cell filamentation protein Fic [Anaerolinea sp.]
MVGYNPTIRENEAGRAVRVGSGELAYEAFVPAPLPPRLELSYDLLRALSEADRALGELSGLGRTLSNPDLLINPFIRKEAVLSSRIEGTQATLTDIYMFEARGIPRPTHEAVGDLREVMNYVAALRYGLDRIDELPMSARLIRELHERLMAGVRGQERSPGEFRTSQNWIGAPESLLADASYVPPPPAEMNETITEFERYVNREMDPHPPLIRLGLIHVQFEMIHPFIDGNGRIGRLLTSLLLVHWGLLPVPLLYLSAYLERERSAYYSHLNAVSDHGAWTDWLVFFLRGVAEQSRDATARAKRLQDLQTAWREAVTHARSSALLLRLVDHLFRSPVITVPAVRDLLGVTYPAAKANIEKLVQAGIVEPFDVASYGRRYWAPQVIRTIGE